MDNYDFYGPINAWEVPARKALGETVSYAARFDDLSRMIPTKNPNECSTTYCMGNATDLEYIAYQSNADESITIDLPAGDYIVETLDTKDYSRSTAVLDNWQ
jgi:hypothetical protein